MAKALANWIPKEELQNSILIKVKKTIKMLEAIRSFAPILKSDAKESLINEKLPPEIIQYIILPQLSQEDEYASASACKSWYSLIKSNLTVKCLKGVDEVIKFLRDNLDPKFDKQKTRLSEVETKRIIDSKTRIGVYQTVYVLKEQILNILKDLDNETLQNLFCLTSATLSLPSFLINFAQESKLYRKLEILEMQDPDTQREGLVVVAKSLAALGNIKKCLEAAKKIAKTSVRDQTLRDIFRQQVTSGNLQKAGAVLDMISDEGKQDEEDRRDICIFEYLRRGDFEKAFRKINKRLFKIRENPLLSRDDFFLGMSMRLLKANDISGTLAYVKMISGSLEIETALDAIFPALVENKDLEAAFTIIKNVFIEGVKNSLLAKFYKELLEKDNFEWARKIARELTQDNSEQALIYISVIELAKKGEIKEALEEIFDKITERKQNQAILDICLIALVQGQIQEGKETASAITDEVTRNIALDAANVLDSKTRSSNK